MEQAKNGTRKGGRKALWAAVAVIAIAAAGLTGYKITREDDHVAAKSVAAKHLPSKPTFSDVFICAT